MTHRNDYKRDSMQTILGSSIENIDTLEIAYLQAAGATADDVNGAWMQVFLANGATSTNFNTAAEEFLVSLGATGDNLPDNWYWFWVTNGGVITPATYDPLWMTFDGSTSYYDKASITTSGNKVFAVIRFNRASFTGGGIERVINVVGDLSVGRITAILGSSDHATPDRQNVLDILVQNSAGAVICRMLSINNVMDGDHVAFFSFDGDAGTAIYEIDDVDADDTGNGTRVAPTTGTLDSGSSSAIGVGAQWNGGDPFGGKLSYVAYDDQYLTNSEDFMTGTLGGVKELDTSGWTEIGSQPLLFAEDAKCDTNNDGSLGSLTKNGTITGPA